MAALSNTTILRKDCSSPFSSRSLSHWSAVIYGMRTTGGTQGVGRSTTKAVVVSSVWIFYLTAISTVVRELRIVDREASPCNPRRSHPLPTTSGECSASTT